MEIEPRWGLVKRDSAGIDRRTYDEVVTAARWVYDRMVSHSGGPAKCTVRSLGTPLPPPPNDSWKKLRSYISNFYLHHENIKSAAMARDFTLV